MGNKKTSKTKARVRKQKLNIRQLTFIDAYIANRANSHVRDIVTQSAIDAGYSKKTAYQQGSRLLKKAEIWNEIEKRLSRVAKKTDATLEKLIAEISNIAHSDITTLFTTDERGRRILKKFEDMTPEQRQMISELQFSKNGIKFKIWPKTAALDMLMKWRGAYVTKHAFTDPLGEKDYGALSHDELVKRLLALMKQNEKA